jgi:hypothetical protein
MHFEGERAEILSLTKAIERVWNRGDLKSCGALCKRRSIRNTVGDSVERARGNSEGARGRVSRSAER